MVFEGRPMKPHARLAPRPLLFVAAIACLPSCSDGGSDSSDGVTLISPDTELTGPGMNLSGGSAGPGGQGGAGGTGVVVTQGAILLGDGTAPGAPTPPPAP